MRALAADRVTIGGPRPSALGNAGRDLKHASSAGGPIVSPAVGALLVTPAAPHSVYNRGVMISARDTVRLEILPTYSRLAVEVDG
jgi:hypothetical protein